MKNAALDCLESRTRRLNKRRIISKKRAYVLCWVMQSLRAEENPLIDRAIALGNELGLPVVVVQTLENRYPYASHRIHRFILEASVELEEGVERRGLRFMRYVRVGQDAPGAVEVVAKLARCAAAVLVDDVPLFVTKDYADQLSVSLERPVLAVDACCLVPMNLLTTHKRTTPAFRKAHSALRAVHIETDLKQVSNQPLFEGSLEVEETTTSSLSKRTMDAFIRSTGVDMTLPPAPDFPGFRSVALKHLSYALDEIIPRYKWTRNNPAVDGTTKLSPWVHFGVLSPREITVAVKKAEEQGGLHSAARYKFLDELLTWREYHYHRARHHEKFASYSGLQDWARDTLDEHRGDSRKSLYSLDQLLQGQTSDRVWNAGQKQFLHEGWMHNNVRMYWVKQLIKWTATPEAAFATACYLNDRLSLDGRDPSTYGGIRWGFGDSKPYLEQAVYGTVPRKTSSALMKRRGVSEWVEKMNALGELPDLEADSGMLDRYL